MATYKIHYFPASARSEYIKLILEEAGVPYEHINYAFGEHKKIPAEHCPYVQLPVLQEGDFYLAQTQAIISYLAKKHGLYPSDPKLAAKSEEVIGGVNDSHPTISGYVLMKRGTKEEVVAHIKSWFTKFDGVLKRNHGGKGFVVGDQLTPADLALFNIIDVVRETFPSVLTDFPDLVAFHGRIAARPKIAAYLKSDRRFHLPSQE